MGEWWYSFSFIKCITWNLKGIVGKASKQMDAITQLQPDILAFQEVTLNSIDIIRKKLSVSYTNIVNSLELAQDKSVLVGPRRYGVLIATNYKIQTLDPKLFDIPWQERILSAKRYY